MSFFKYYRERRDADGEQLWWPGGPEGFPFRGPQPPQTKQEEFDNLKLSGKLRCKTFYLANKEELQEYITIRDKCANGLYVPLDRDRVWDESSKGYRIFLEWLEMAYDVPDGANKDAIKEHVSQSQGTVLPITRLAGFSQGW